MKRTQSTDELPYIKNQLNAHLYPKNYEINNDPSETIPDQAMTLSEILRRFASGLPLGGPKVELYDGGEDDIYDGINPATLDMSERHDMVQNAIQELEEINERLTQNQQKKAKYQERKKWEAEHEKKLNSEQKVLEKPPTKEQ